MEGVAPGLWVTNESEASRATDVDTIVCLLHEPPAHPDGVRVLEHPLVDGPQCDAADFASAVEAVRAARRREETVLVHCASGTSRSVAVVATALAAEDGTDLDDAVARVVAARAGADSHPALLSLGEAYLERA